MSHFTVLVIGENPEAQLAPYDENLEVDRYVKKTKEQVISDARKEIEEYKNGMYAEYLADPVEYAKNCKPEHLKYISKEFPKKLSWSDEEVYKDATDWYESEDIGPEGEIYSERNPNSKWDWYSLGGRWAGFFLLKEKTFGKQGHHRAKDFATLTGEYVPDLPENKVDQAYKRDIDFAKMRTIAEEHAGKEYDLAMSIISHLPVNKTWEVIREEVKSIDKAREIFWEQPRCQAWKTEERRDFKNFPFGWDSSPDDFIMLREEYVATEGQAAAVPFALIKDGQWYEKGDMGWWGMVSNERDQKEWNKKVWDLINSVPDDTLFSLYDCHI